MAGGPGYASASDYQHQSIDITQKPQGLWSTFVEQARGYLAIFFKINSRVKLWTNFVL